MPPQAVAGEDVSVIAEKNGTALVSLNSLGSSDPEDRVIQHSWTEIIGDEEFFVSNEASLLIELFEGEHIFRLVVYDEYFAQSSDEVLVRILPYEGEFIRGDCNTDNEVDIADAIKILFSLFLGQQIDCEDACDSNDSGDIDISDAVYALRFIFLSGQLIPEPYPMSGMDETQDTLSCKR